MTTPISAARRAPAEQLEGRWRWGWIFAGLWLLYLTQTLQLVLDNPHISLRVIGTLALAAFGAHPRTSARTGAQVDDDDPAAPVRWLLTAREAP